jgi:hypothetical protein
LKHRRTPAGGFRLDRPWALDAGRILRGAIDEGLTRLARAVAALGNLDVDRFCDQLLARVVTGRTDDDIALLAVRCHPVPPG